MNWKRRFSKVLGAFFTGYGGGFAVMLPANGTLSPENIQWFWIFVLPILAGLVVTWPQLGKVFSEYGNMGKDTE